MAGAKVQICSMVGKFGIGLATAKQFVNEGAYVFITGRRDPELNTVGRLGDSVVALLIQKKWIITL